MPVVVVEGIEHHRWSDRAEELFQNPRRIQRAEETPLFRPVGRRIRRVQE